MAENSKPKQRGPGKPFTKGVSGNPSGKPRGCRHKATRAAQALLEGEVEALTRKAVEKALEGDTGALKLCLERLVPPMKERPIQTALKLPAKVTVENAPEIFGAIFKAVASGGLCPGEGETLQKMLNLYLSATEYMALEQRISELEAQNGGQSW
jgi:hypothetical protein